MSVILLAGVAGMAYFYWDTLFTDVQRTEPASSVATGGYERRDQERQIMPELRVADAEQKKRRTPERNRESVTKTGETSAGEQKKGREVTAGWVLITDSWGGEVAKFRSGLVGSGWLALPARACLGGSSWYFEPDSHTGQRVEISDGRWILGDKVGLWHLEEAAKALEGPGLEAWNRQEPLSWISLESPRQYHSLQLYPGRVEGFFISTSLPDSIDEIGMFFQGDKIVGWTFGQWLAKGFLWPEKSGAEPQYNTWVRYFYTTTFANGREEKFAMALAMQKDHGDLDQLRSFVEGFQLQPKLAEEDTPFHLLPEEIIKHMRSLVTRALQGGEREEVVALFSGQVIKKIGDINLLIDVVPAIAAERGFEAAVNEIEDSGKFIAGQTRSDVPALDELHVQLYQDWLQLLVSDGEADEGTRVYNSAKAMHPDDAYIHLLGVELELLNDNWQEAERLLYMRSYPPQLQDRYELLAGRISEMKGREGKIFIRFAGGSNRIPVTGTVNERIYQDFLVDTGSSMVTIPSSTADALGLEADLGYHGRERTVSTAGGVVTAHEVLIEMIEINGWIEYDVKALVLDIPEQPGLGLLGLNYLKRFQMDLETEKGTLLLTPQ